MTATTTTPATTAPHPRKIKIHYLLLGLLVICTLMASMSALSNRNLPTVPTDLTQLTPLDYARLSESHHLRKALGEQVWPGWGEIEIPHLVYNPKYAFLFDYPTQPQGWDLLEGTTFHGRPVYRQPAIDSQAFAVQVDGIWVSSISTKWAMDLFLIDEFRDAIPTPFDAIFPYRVLIQPTEVYMTGNLHEGFHAYQATAAPERFEDAQLAYAASERYEAVEEQMREDWRTEIDLLIEATKAETDEEVIILAREFLNRRTLRREQAGLDDTLILYEQRLEWLEGLAKYAELGIWEAGANTPGYAPLAELAEDPGFQQYDTFNRRWSSELVTMRNMGIQPGDVRFYYTGMIQARLLDRLMPNWKDRIMAETIWLDQLLTEALEGY